MEISIMTGINATTIDRRKAGVRRAQKSIPKIDMTPMVDLGFLLITFFVITAELSKPVTMDLFMPNEGPPTKLGKSDALTCLLGMNKTLYYYHGDWEEALAANQVFQTSYSAKQGIRKVIHEKQLQLDINNRKEGRRGLMLLIKPGKDADYSDVIDLLDEALINDVKKYALLKADEEETKWLATKSRKH
ncbi:MAG: ExbD/TolR family protein [Chitinophagaceae bacterium]